MDRHEHFLFQIILPHTDPKTPIISNLQHASHAMVNGGEVPEDIKRILLLNNSIWLKSEFAKSSFRVIQECYSNYAQLLDDGNYLVKPQELLPALKEINSLLFELGSILDFFAREINTVFNLGIDYRTIGFGRVVHICKKTIPDENITELVTDFSSSEWYNYFRDMRNRITHRLPFVMRGMNDQVFFPDDPMSDDVGPSTEKQIDLIETCDLWLNSVLRFVDRTSLVVFTKIARFEAISKETGEQIDADAYFKSLIEE